MTGDQPPNVRSDVDRPVQVLVQLPERLNKVRFPKLDGN